MPEADGRDGFAFNPFGRHVGVGRLGLRDSPAFYDSVILTRGTSCVPNRAKAPVLLDFEMLIACQIQFSCGRTHQGELSPKLADDQRLRVF